MTPSRTFLGMAWLWSPTSKHAITGLTKSLSLNNVANAVVHMANLPPDVNILTMTTMANGMPFVGRG